MEVTVNRKKQLILMIALGLAFFQCIFMEVFETIWGVHLIYSVLYSLLVFAWIHYDNSRYQYKRSRSFNMGLLLLSSVFFPIYIYKTRQRVKAACKAVGAILLIWLMIIILNMVGLVIYANIKNPTPGPSMLALTCSCLLDPRCEIVVFGRTLRARDS